MGLLQNIKNLFKQKETHEPSKEQQELISSYNSKLKYLISLAEEISKTTDCTVYDLPAYKSGPVELYFSGTTQHKQFQMVLHNKNAGINEQSTTYIGKDFDIKDITSLTKLQPIIDNLEQQMYRFMKERLAPEQQNKVSIEVPTQDMIDTSVYTSTKLTPEQTNIALRAQYRRKAEELITAAETISKTLDYTVHNIPVYQSNAAELYFAGTSQYKQFMLTWHDKEATDIDQRSFVYIDKDFNIPEDLPLEKLEKICAAMDQMEKRMVQFMNRETEKILEDVPFDKQQAMDRTLRLPMSEIDSNINRLVSAKELVTELEKENHEELQHDGIVQETNKEEPALDNSTEEWEPIGE